MVIVFGGSWIRFLVTGSCPEAITKEETLVRKSLSPVGGRVSFGEVKLWQRHRFGRRSMPTVLDAGKYRQLQDHASVRVSSSRLLKVRSASS
jgi:hypothetical protein